MALTDKLTAIANAIRAKTGKSDSLTLDQMPTEIANIETGGGGAEKPFDCHSVTFVYGDKSYVRSVADGDTCADPVSRGLISAPTKESTAQYNYTFYGWGASDGGAADANILKNITEDKTVYAIFTATVRYYTITWLDEDGATVLKTESLAYGTMPSYTPTKEGAAFNGWDKELAIVTGNASYTASWVEVVGGSCGDSANWMFNSSTGTLTIYGTGAMANYAHASVPWADCRSGIKEIVINEGITSIGNYAFASCGLVTDITIPNSVTSISGSAFTWSPAIENITLGKGVVYDVNTNYSWFNSCRGLRGIWVDADNPNLCNDEHGVLFNKAMTTLYLAPKSISGSYTIPDTVTNIESYAFRDCTGLTASPLRDGITRVGEHAFNGCSGIKNITIYSSITTLGAYNHSSSGISNGSVTMQVTSGWWHADTENGASKGAIPEAQFTNAKTRREMFTSLGYAGYWWHRS